MAVASAIAAQQRLRLPYHLSIPADFPALLAGID